MTDKQPDLSYTKARMQEDLARAQAKARETAAKKSLLETASEIVNGDRQRYYGHPLDNHGNTAQMWSSWLRRKFGFAIELSAEDVCWLMVLLKASREANRHNPDNEVDAVGYLLNAEMIRDERVVRKSGLGVTESAIYKAVQALPEIDD